MIVSTTRSPRVYPILTEVSTFDQLIEKKLPILKKIIGISEPDLFHMVTALDKKKRVFK